MPVDDPSVLPDNSVDFDENMSPQQMAESMVKIGRYCLVTQGRQSHLALILNDKGAHIIPLNGDEKDSEAWPKMLAQLAYVMRAKLVGHCSEAWEATAPANATDEELHKIRPRDREDRREVLLASCRDQKGEIFTISHEFDRDADGKPVFKKEPRLMAWKPSDDEKERPHDRLLDNVFYYQENPPVSKTTGEVIPPEGFPSSVLGGSDAVAHVTEEVQKRAMERAMDQKLDEIMGSLTRPPKRMLN